MQDKLLHKPFVTIRNHTNNIQVIKNTNKDLFYIVPGYRSKIKLRNFKPAAETTVSILGNNKSLSFKQAGNDCIIDLSGMQPGEMSPELFVIKLKNAL